MNENSFPTLGLSNLDPYGMTATERELTRQVDIRNAAQRLLDLGGTRNQVELARQAISLADRHINATRSRLTHERKRNGLR